MNNSWVYSQNSRINYATILIKESGSFLFLSETIIVSEKCDELNGNILFAVIISEVVSL